MISIDIHEKHSIGERRNGGIHWLGEEEEGGGGGY